MIDARVLVYEHGATMPVQKFLERLRRSKCDAKFPDVDLHVALRLPAFSGFPRWGPPRSAASGES